MGKNTGRGFESGAVGYNRHHRIPKSKLGNNHEDNIKVMEVIKHRALHILYENQLPIEQLQTSLRINTPALGEECNYEIAKLLDFWKKEGRGAYNPKVFKR